MNARVRNESHTRSTNEIVSRRTRPSRESSNETEPRFIERDETRINERDETRINEQDRLGNNSRHLMSTRAPLKGVSAVNTLIGQPVYLEVKIDSLLSPSESECKMPFLASQLQYPKILVSDSNFGYNYVNRSNIWMEDSGKHHQLGQSTKSALDPTGNLYNNKWGKEIYSDSYTLHKKYQHQ